MSGRRQAPETAESENALLKLLVLGFNETERRLLHAIVKLSQRRKPALHLLEASDGQLADVILIDALHLESVQWAAAQPWLDSKPVAWVDSANDPLPGHTKLDRPVQWPILPMLLSRILFNSEDLQLVEPAAGTDEKSTAAPARTTSPGSTAGKRILVVDDSLAVRRQLKTFLEKKGLEPTFAENGEVAVANCQTTAYDCILLDVLMPGIDGYETCRRIKALPHMAQTAKVIMLTSRTSPFDRIRDKMAGCDAYLTKPVEPQKLHSQAVEKLINHGTCAILARSI